MWVSGPRPRDWRSRQSFVGTNLVEQQTVLQLLASLRFSSTLPRDACARIAGSAVVREFPAGTLLFREGEKNENLLIVSQGRVALDMYVPGRGNIRVLSVGPGDMVAWSALLENGRMTASAVAVEDTQVVALPAADVLVACEIDPSFGFQFMRLVFVALAERLLATRLQLLDLFADTAPQAPLQMAND